MAPRTSRVALLGLSGLNPKGESFTTLFMSSRQAIDYVIRNAPIGVIGAAQFSDLVHTSPGVVVPERIAYSLAVGLKYM